MTLHTAELRFNPRELDKKWQDRWATDGIYRVRDRRPMSQAVRAHHVPVPFRGCPYRPLVRHGPRGCPRKVPPHAGPQRAPPYGLRLLRPPRRERGYQAGHPSLRLDHQKHRAHASTALLHGRHLRLGQTDQLHGAGVLQMEPVDFPEALSGRPRLPGQRPRQLVPLVPDRIGQ